MNISLNSSLIRRVVYFLIIFSLFAANMLALPKMAHAEGKLNKQEIQKKIKELKKKEQVEIKKLTSTQKNLEKTKKTITKCKNDLWKSRVNLSNLQSKHNSLERERSKIASIAKKRIRNIYKGQRTGFLQTIFASQDLSTFFDRLYYQKSIIKKDEQLISQLKLKSNEILRSKRTITYEKKFISNNLEYMNRKQRRLNYSKQTSEYLINKLRTDRQAYEEAQRELASLSKNIEKDIINKISTETILDSVFIKPVAGAISSPYGWRVHPIFKSRRFHSGIDIAGRNRSPIKASNSGKVIHSGWYGGYGKVVIINHGVLTEGTYAGKKVSTLYAHMNRTVVRVGDYIKKGQVVGYEGSTGYSTGPHLHFEVRIDGKTVNPRGFIK